MPRSMSEKYDEAFRVAEKLSYPSGGSTVSYYGPYATAGAAKGQATTLRREHQMWDRHATLETWIEKSSAAWERVE